MLPRRIFAVATTLQRNLQRWEMGSHASMVRERFFSTQSEISLEETIKSKDANADQEISKEPLETTKRRQPRKNPSRRRARGSDTTTKWKAPFWLPPPSSSSSSQTKRSKPSKFQARSKNRFRDASLPCRKHLDPSNSFLPTSDWVQIFGALPTTSLEEILVSIEGVLEQEFHKGTMVDLDAHWNPHRDGETPPLVPSILEVPLQATPRRPEYALDQGEEELDEREDTTTSTTRIQMECFRVIKAHVVLSPFGRPTGWNLQLANPSIVHALLSHANTSRVQGNLRIGWKFAKVQEYLPSNNNNNNNNYRDTSSMLVVSDSMVRFENCPHSLTEDTLRHMLSRYELTPKGSTIIKWKGQTSDGRVPPPTFVVRFASPAYARAAVRELQGKLMDGKPMKLIQYPKQLL